MSHTVPISISDADPDSLAPNLPSIRVDGRRRPRRFAFPPRRSRNDILLFVVHKIFKYWTLIICLFALSFLAFAVFSSVTTSDLIRIDELGKRSSARMIGSVDATRCLKLLSPEELEHLEVPTSKPSFPVKEVVYVTEDLGSSAGGDFNASLHVDHLKAGRFNMFTGYQTLEEREQSFTVNETAVIHCGFYSEKGGFEISEEDKAYTKTCKVVVSTCAFGGGDDLYQPIGMSARSIRVVCYVAFWDDITLATQESQGQKVGKDHMIGKWRIMIVRKLPFADQRLNGKVPKMLSHRLFPEAQFSIWVDSKSQFRRDPLGVLEALLWRTDSVLAISEHGARSNVYDEAKAVVKKNKATPEEVELQLSQYRKDGFPDDARFRGKKALAEASIIVREHTQLTNLFMCLWFNEVVRFTSRDQLSFPYVLRQLGALTNINMFRVCTRKDLVNSMRHKRKAKPLIPLNSSS
uniref:TOD1/MUCI70 glycosyltransferase-like domain-containing protein n=1 Tax=Kalanchoe fedtschenkoi TaxID=63787 RepID=A0A7N0ZTY8_KALFE